jgi:3-deoxy-D-manno-octulosonic-acid transferase
MGFGTIRGSSSRGGASAALELVKVLKKGYPVAVTPDGPRGPAKVVKKGVSLIARRAGVPVVPYGVSAFPALRLKTWDRFLIPLPFAKIVISEGRPIFPENCTEQILNAAISSETHRAELATSPAASCTITLIRTFASILAVPAWLFLRFRPETERRERWGQIEKTLNRPVWLHGSSLGELQGLLPVVHMLEERGIPIFITCSTVAAREFLEKENLPGAFQPVDTPAAVAGFLDNLQPSALILAETEFWPVLLYETVSRGITAGMVNARLSRKSASRYKLIKPLFSRTLGCFRGILSRSHADRERFKQLGVATEYAGDSKAEVKPAPPDPTWRNRIKRGNNGILVAGSTRKGEEKILLEIARETGLTPVIVPRHERRISEVVKTAEKAGYSPDLWSANPTRSQCLIVDTKGILASLYGLADIAFVGGTLAPLGGHNILEPLAHGIPVVVGPEHGNYTDVVNKASENDICRVFTSAENGIAAVRELLKPGSREPELNFTEELFVTRLKELLKKMDVIQ